MLTAGGKVNILYRRGVTLHLISFPGIDAKGKKGIFPSNYVNTSISCYIGIFILISVSGQIGLIVIQYIHHKL
jgi:hypothetical protein